MTSSARELVDEWLDEQDYPEEIEPGDETFFAAAKEWCGEFGFSLTRATFRAAVRSKRARMAEEEESEEI